MGTVDYWEIPKFAIEDGLLEGALNRVRVARVANGPSPYTCQIVKPRGHAVLFPPYRSLLRATSESTDTTEHESERSKKSLPKVY